MPGRILYGEVGEGCIGVVLGDVIIRELTPTCDVLKEIRQVFQAAVAHTLIPQAEPAAEFLVNTALEQLNGIRPTAALLFNTFGRKHSSLLRAIHQKLPDIPLVGGSSQGEVSLCEGYQLGSTVLVLIASDRISIHTGVARDLDVNNYMERIANAITRTCVDAMPKVALIFPDGILGNGVDGAIITQAFADVLPDTLIFGGATAEDFSFRSTDQFFGIECLSRAVPFLLFSGPVHCAWDVTAGWDGGWRPVGPRFKADVDGYRIRRINGKPAVDFLGKRFKLCDGQLSVCHPLAVYTESNGGEALLRDVPSYDPNDGSLMAMQKLPDTCWVQLTDPVPEHILGVAGRSLHRTLGKYPRHDVPALGLCFSCISRAVVLNQDPGAEFRAIIAGLHDLPPLAGFYSYGEIAPHWKSKKIQYHSSTIVTLLLGEETAPKIQTHAFRSEKFTNDMLRWENERLEKENAELKARLEQGTDYSGARGDVFQLEQRKQQYADILGLLLRFLESHNCRLPHAVTQGDPAKINQLGLARLLLVAAKKEGICSLNMKTGTLAKKLSTILALGREDKDR